MAFVVRIFYLSAVLYCARAGLAGHHGHHGQDSYISSAANAPSASYGPPSGSYGPPSDSSGSLNLATSSDPGYPASGPSQFSEGNLILDSNRLPETSGSLNLDANRPASSISTAVGPPRVIGTTVQVGQPQTQASRYELETVVQNVVRRIPVEIIRHVQVAVPVPQPVPVRQEVRVPVPQPYQVPVEVIKQVPYPVYRDKQVEVERRVPYEVVKQVPVEVIRKVQVPVDRPYEVIKKIRYPVVKHVEVPVTVWKPKPVHIIKHITHYPKKKCCWGK